MPNHIANRLVVTANSNEEIKGFLARIKSDKEFDGREQEIDFNKIIPMPMCLRDTEESSTTNNGIYYYLMTSNQADLIPKVLSYPSFYTMERFANKTEQELCNLFAIGEKYVGIYKKVGATTWYDWSCRNWGTKWNAYETAVEESDNEFSIILTFQTAWSGVPNIIQKLIEMFPTFTFEYNYADEDMGHNCGEGYGSDGDFSFNRLQGGSKEAIEIYALCWDYDLENFYQDEEGHWHNREWEDEDDCEDEDND